MKLFKKVVAMAAMGAMAVAAFAGCSTQNSGSADKFYIGGIGPVTGDAAVYGNCCR